MQARIQEWLELAFMAAAEHFAKPKTSIKIIIKHGGEHADYACSSALMLAKAWQLPPLTIANFIADFQLPDSPRFCSLGCFLVRIEDTCYESLSNR